ncbi:amino acid permease [Coccidioides immitis RMSCC 3703]|uniref:Amino acid permease n=1 Tax=Coccidioides immitis RMSCC 3703 TaxID=454286 RepID=A0A0J8R6L4_COCIT|nr:amino acid permease [Coccidioides immitis RMSCC 3703]
MSSELDQIQPSHHQPSMSVLPAGDIPVMDHKMDEDERIIVSLGYKQEFKREFSLWTTFCVSFSVLGLLPSFASTLWYGMGYAGTAGMVWGWIIAMIFIQCVAMGMAELCSSMPTSVIWTMSGYDSPFHLSEECSNANIASPRAIVLTSGVGGLMGWFLQVVVAYTVKDIDEVLMSELGQPWASYLFQVMPRKAAVAILALTIICGFSMGQACMIAASRVTYAYARDDCFPLSRIWKKVNKHTQTPVNAVWFNCVVGILSTLLIFAGDLAMGALFSIGAIAAFVAFSIPIGIRIFVVKEKFRPGPWNLGRYSRVIGGTGVSFVILMLPILCLPAYTGSDLTPKEMNWTCIVYGAPMIGVLIWWIVDARRWFKGPKVNVEHHMLDRVQIGVDRVDTKGSEKEAVQQLESVDV